MNHTPAPWSADAAGLITAGPNRLHIAQAATKGMSHAADANARLIAAAPAMLEALHLLIGAAEQHAMSDDPDVKKELETARAAYNQATKGA